MAKASEPSGLIVQRWPLRMKAISLLPEWPGVQAARVGRASSRRRDRQSRGSVRHRHVFCRVVFIEGICLPSFGAIERYGIIFRTYYNTGYCLICWSMCGTKTFSPQCGFPTATGATVATLYYRYNAGDIERISNDAR